MTDRPAKRPGDVILDRYMPDATEVEREAARENLHQYAGIVFGIAKRLMREEREAARGLLSELATLVEFEYP